MAKVDRAETPITVNKVAFSFWAWLGNAADNANAAEAPQIAVAPPVIAKYQINHYSNL